MFSISFPVRSYELDSYNHVNNAVYLSYLEFTRMEYLTATGFDYQKFAEAGYMLYVTSVNIKYKLSARLFDTLTVEVYPIKLRKASGTFKQIIKNQHGDVCVEAEVGWACVSRATGKPTKLPDEYITAGLKPAE
ncbi:acyl-CoA thioesterase [Treponema phagedenis]|uniref:Acyl-CoA thioester hydrolase, YbgC/YbaW family n=1 Tax=Treponema phagedenis TaxID=162 RepID=A0A0B7H1H2_TREPH|nr:thioesterase family protein [Treponema phagedenis]EFW37040.1 acyl-CoA thioester hydrolase, YbgC/YbaW family [Treponema phagedenis F0421]NVP25478.1 acyl-CoA thioesterase [Treponema phagedenis]QEJ93956.1 acyl-CoA thioesterase [Treponema phagedenis]QEJ96722.1 acyl-CoA thioesterase [Treponema phagedenis]QEJ96793.1 acyl-CoA thioesterase [Treponema phagedenis]